MEVWVRGKEPVSAQVMNGVPAPRLPNMDIQLTTHLQTQKKKSVI
jgi:hypothetical protein